MDKEQYDEIVKTLGFLLEQSLETKMKLTALEKSLQEMEYPLFDHYLREIENLKRNKAFQTNSVSISALMQRLRE